MGAPSGSQLPNIDNGPRILIVSWVEAVLGLAVLTARVYTRSRIIRNVGWDDWAMIFATILALVTTILVTLEVHYGVGRHNVYLQPSSVVNAVKIIWLTVPFSTMSACFGKISISLLLMRIMNRNKAQKAFLWCLIISLFIVNLLLTIITFSQCTPVTFLWDQLNPHVTYRGTCWSSSVQQDYGYFQGAFSSFSDLVLALFPILIIRDLQMKRRIKLGLCAVMSLGIFATAASILKTVELHNLATPDFTWNATDLVYWYITENWVIVIAACIPTLAPLYLVLLGKQSRESFCHHGYRQTSGSLWNGSWSRLRRVRLQFKRFGGMDLSQPTDKTGNSSNYCDSSSQPRSFNPDIQTPSVIKQDEFRTNEANEIKKTTDVCITV